MPSAFAGTLAEFDAERKKAAETPSAPAAAAPAPVPVEKPAEEPPPAPEPEAKAEEPAQEVPAEAPPAEEKPAETPAQAAARKKWKLKGKVAGEEKEWEVDEDALENPESEAHKALVARFQKAEDYDRPGGAVDQRALREVQTKLAKEMIDKGVWVVDPVTNTVDWSPKIKAAMASKDTPPAETPSATPEPSPRQKRIGELETKMKADLKAEIGIDPDEHIEYMKLVAQESAAGELDTRTAAERRAATEAEQRRRAETEATERQKRNDEAGQRELQNIVKSHEEKYRHPVTKALDQGAMQDVERIIRDAVRTTYATTGDALAAWNAGKTAAADHATRHAATMRTALQQSPAKKPTGAAPPPIHRGATSPGTKPKPKDDDGYDPRKPFSKQSGLLPKWEKERAGAAG